MTLNVRFYGMFQIVTGLMESTVEVPEKSSLATALKALVFRFPRLLEAGLVRVEGDVGNRVEVPDFVVVAVNKERVPVAQFESHLLNDNDTVHFAPVSIGGVEEFPRK